MASNGGNNNLYSNPCLDWMNSPINQVLAIAALARFFNLEKIKNLFYNTPQHNRAGLLVRVLYDVCGWLLDPENGMEGLFRSGHWEHCYHAVRAFIQGAKIIPLRRFNLSHQMRGRSNVVARRDGEIHGSIGYGKRPMTEGDGDEQNSSKRPCFTSERGGPSGINQSQRSQVMKPKEDEISLELTLGRPEYRKM